MNQLNLPDGLSVRPSRASDKPFLEKLHQSTREDLQLIDGEKAFVESIIEMQFRAQTEGYGEKFPNAMYFIIEKHWEPIGKATLDFGSNEIRVVDLAFIQKARNQGFGKSVIQAFQRCAHQVMTPLTLSVLQNNIPAKRLYASLGFQVESVSPPYEFMIWHPMTTVNAAR